MARSFSIKRLVLTFIVSCLSLSFVCSATDYVNFNFDGVDIRLLIKIVGEMTGRQFVVNESVAGKVTVVTPPQVPTTEVYPLFLAVLESKGLTVVQNGNIHEIVPAAPRDLPSGPVVGAGAPLPAGGVVTRVIKLEHVNATDVKKILEPLVAGGKGGAVLAFGATNHLIITDTVENIRRLEVLIAQLDQSGVARSLELVPLKHAAAESVAQQLTQALSGMDKNKWREHLATPGGGGAALGGESLAIPAVQANAVILVAPSVQMKELKELVALLDTEVEAARGPLQAIFLSYLDAEEAAKSLNALLEKAGGKDQKREISIEVSKANNALIVHANARDFEWVKNLVTGLDHLPEQVLVEILIAEVSDGKSLDLGVEWSTTELPQNGKEIALGRIRPGEEDTVNEIGKNQEFPQGLTLGVAKGMYVNAQGQHVPIMPFLIRALAKNSDVKILSNVPLWAQNNNEASVIVVENIPILTSTVSAGAGTARDYIQNIERRDVGIKLKLTPHVNPEKEVTLQLNPIIEAVIDEGPPGKYTPRIAIREVKTTVTVPDKATVAISGLIREDRYLDVGKVPFLGDIPILGWLFKHERTKVRRTNLLIFVTPTIVNNQTEAQELQREWSRKTALTEQATNVVVRTKL